MTKLSLMLHRDLETGEWFVDRVEAERNNVRTQTKFCVPYPIRMAFSEDFVTYLNGVLPASTASSAVVFGDQDLPTLALGFSKLRVIAQRALAGLQSVSIRAHDVVGTVSNIFSPSLTLDGPNQTRSVTARIS